jgi:hypothetical protein
MVSSYTRTNRADCPDNFFPRHPGENQIAMPDLDDLEICPAQPRHSGFNKNLSRARFRYGKVFEAERPYFPDNDSFHHHSGIADRNKVGGSPLQSLSGQPFPPAVYSLIVGDGAPLVHPTLPYFVAVL